MKNIHIVILIAAIGLAACTPPDTTNIGTAPTTEGLVDNGENPDYSTKQLPGYTCKYTPRDKDDFLGDLYAGEPLYSRPSPKSKECTIG